MENYQKILNHELLIDVYGYWPVFHDGEIHRFSLERVFDVEFGCNCGAIDIVLHGWEMTSKVVGGYYKLVKHNIVHFRFLHVDDVEIDGFDDQNAIDSINFEVAPKNDRGHEYILVTIEPGSGVSAQFKALSCEVVSVEPCNRKGLKS